jgi:hypothetical protein
MAKKKVALDFLIDKLTNSIENAITGDTFSTEISLLLADDLKNLNYDYRNPSSFKTC